MPCVHIDRRFLTTAGQTRQATTAATGITMGNYCLVYNIDYGNGIAEGVELVVLFIISCHMQLSAMAPAKHEYD